MNPFDAVAEFILGKMKESMLSAWLRFAFELGFSATVSFLFSAGSLLFAGQGVAISIGFGMLWAGMALMYLFRRERSKLTRGMIVALPGDEAAREMQSNFQVVEKSEQEK